MADRIISQEKTIAKNVVLYILFTEQGDHYRVIQLLRAKDYCESIYFIKHGIPTLVRQVYLPLNKYPAPNFEKFIECGNLFDN